jgi:GTPase SAR1 family protein
MGNLVSSRGSVQKKHGNHPGILLAGGYDSGKSEVLTAWTGKKHPEYPDLTDYMKLQRDHGIVDYSWSYGGRGFYRQAWRSFAPDLDVIVFVVDSRPSKMQAVQFELKHLFQEDKLRGLPLLVLCNKQDAPDAKPPQEIAKLLGLKDVSDRPWTTNGCVSTTGAGLDKAMHWIVKEAPKLRAAHQEATKQSAAEKEAAAKTSSSATQGFTSESPSSTNQELGKDASREKPKDESLTSLLQYDPSENSTLQHFQPIRESSNCPFAKASKLWGARTTSADGAHNPNGLEELAKVNAAALTEFTRRSDAGENLDGFCFELTDRHAVGATPEELGVAVRRLLTALSDLDPAGEAVMTNVNYIGSRGWRFRFAKADFFVTTFAPCYPVTSSRYAFGTGRAFLLLQPELSFLRHKLPLDTPHTAWEEPVTIRDKTRVAFRQAGREYSIPSDTTLYPAAEHIVKPLRDVQGAVIRWWEDSSVQQGVVLAAS